MNCLCLNTRRAARSLTALYEEHLRECKISPAQFGLLSLLIKRPGICQLEIAEAVGLDQTTLSRNLQLLIANKWIKRSSSSSDRRQSLYAITPAGEKLRKKAQPRWNRAQELMRARLGEDWDTAFILLKRLSDGAEALGVAAVEVHLP
jgi:DNA-binding MarR family transcriptional regulator